MPRWVLAGVLFLGGCFVERSGLGASDGSSPVPDAQARLDGGGVDAGRRDGSMLDGGRDAGRDASTPDGGPRDSGPPDSGPRDSGPPDSGPPDGGPPDCATIFMGVEGGGGTLTLCVDMADRCELLIDRAGGLGTNGDSCEDICESVAGWTCAGADPAGATGGCASGSGSCTADYNRQNCTCTRE